jgi:hypothetical protein
LKQLGLTKAGWCFIPVSELKHLKTPFMSGLTLLIPFITKVPTRLPSGMSHIKDQNQWPPID